MPSTVTVRTSILELLGACSGEAWTWTVRAPDGRDYPGTGRVETSSGQVCFRPTARRPRLGIGDPVHVTFAGGGASHSFYSDVVSQSRQGPLVLATPRLVRTQDGRGRARTSVEDNGLFKVRVRAGRQEADFQVTDVSARGLAFRTPATGFPLFEGQLLGLRLTLPSGRTLKLRVRIVNMRQDPGQVRQRLVGTRFEHAPGDMVKKLQASLKLVA